MFFFYKITLIKNNVKESKNIRTFICHLFPLDLVILRLPRNSHLASSYIYIGTFVSMASFPFYQATNTFSLNPSAREIQQDSVWVAVIAPPRREITLGI